MKTGGLISAATPGKRRLLSSTSGSMTIPGLILFTVAMAVGGLAIDMQRVYGVHGTMQAFVDDVALAAAAELDGQASALTRSMRAAVGDGTYGPLVAGPTNSARFATNTTLTVQKVTFLQAIGTDPGPLASTPAAGDVVLCTYTAPTFAAACEGSETTTTASGKARFVEIVAQPRTVSYMVLPIANAFGQVFGTGQLQTNLQLRATAGFRRAICNNVPLMVCNPAEATQGSGAQFTFTPGRQIKARFQGGGWGPPNFGLLDNYPGNGAAEMREAMAKVSPFTICTEDQVSVKTGQNTGPVGQGMNVRFDIYEGPMGGNNTVANYAPAPNVVKGMRPGNGANGACNPNTSNTSMPLPRDNCFMAAPTPGAGTGCTAYDGENRFGNGQWARSVYWGVNHPATANSPPAGFIDPMHPNGGWSRYETYRYEIEHPDQVSLSGDEQGAPACSTQPVDTHRDRDRRVLYVAVVNCIENAALLGHGPVPVKAYAKVFMTEPVGDNRLDNIQRTYSGVTARFPDVDPQDFMIEVIGTVQPNDESGHLHVYPVLYR
jgi:hypothetical protein